ncbi:MAG: methyltransferase domain-containing protein [Alphaproteobacteria bacterium]|nr:methyltransferase domain-containing protein [Alphaproteobacteria bacterium]
MKVKQDIFTAMGSRVKFFRGDYNITCDAVWLAAFIGHKAYGIRHNILDVGIGTGGVSLCLLQHCPDLRVTGIDISEQMLSECAANAELNGRELELIHGDILKWRTSRTFDTVITNPPYFRGTPRVNSSPRRGEPKDTKCLSVGGKNKHICPPIDGCAVDSPQGGSNFPHHNANLTDWTRACLKRVKPRGYFYCIVDAAAAGEVAAALHTGRAGDINIVPLFGGAAHAERVLISARLGTAGGTVIHAGFSMNDDTILRMGKPLTFAKK